MISHTGHGRGPGSRVASGAKPKSSANPDEYQVELESKATEASEKDRCEDRVKQSQDCRVREIR